MRYYISNRLSLKLKIIAGRVYNERESWEALFVKTELRYDVIGDT
jgi:hypothetical protein